MYIHMHMSAQTQQPGNMKPYTLEPQAHRNALQVAVVTAASIQIPGMLADSVP